MAREQITGIDLPELASTPSNPAAGRIRVYGKADDEVYKLLPNGTETKLGAGGGSKSFAFFAG